MRAGWLCVGLAMVTGMAGACGEGESASPTSPASEGGDAGSSGGSAAGAGGKGSSTGAGRGGVGGSVASSGAGGSGGPNASGAGGEEPEGGGDAGASLAGSAMGGGTGNAGAGGAETSGVAGAAGSDGSAGSAGDCAAAADKLVFVSSELYTGALGGLMGADSKCQALADAAGLCGTYKAWLSDGTGDAAARLTHAVGNYVLTTGEVVASGWAGLTSGTLQHAINVTEKKAAAPVGTVKCAGTPTVPVWSGATFSGVAVANGSCSNWSTTGTGPGAAFGNANATNFAWSGMCQLLALCPNTAALYCLQQ